MKPIAFTRACTQSGGNQTDVWAFRRFDGAEATVVRVVHVTYFETGTLTRQTSRPQGRYATLVRHLGQRVGLVPELRQLVRTEERVDNARQGAGVKSGLPA